MTSLSLVSHRYETCTNCAAPIENQTEEGAALMAWSKWVFCDGVCWAEYHGKHPRACLTQPPHKFDTVTWTTATERRGK